MASRKALVPLLRRSLVSSRTTSNALVSRGGAAPPMPPFARIPACTEKLVENNDCAWDDGVCPELALDFDATHISTWEGIATWAFGFSCFYVLFKYIQLTHDCDEDNPAIPQWTHMADVDHGMIGKPPTHLTMQIQYPFDELNPDYAAAGGGDEDEEEGGDDDDEEDDDDE